MTKQCLILAGGIGSRLGQITKKVPKPLIKINKNIFLDYLIKNLYRQGIREFIILTWYKNKLFKKNLPIKYKESKIKIICEKKKLGTSGAIKNAEKYLHKSFFVVNGDTFFDINIRDLELEINNNASDAGVALVKSALYHKQYNYKINNQNIVTQFKLSNQKKKFVSGGIYYFKKKNLTLLQKGYSDIDKNLVYKIFNRKKITAKIFNKNFIDIGTKKSLKKAPKFINKTLNKPCCFLDRDGVINEEKNYVHKVRDFKWRKNIFKAIKLLNDSNFRVIILTNQAGIAKGFYSEKQFHMLNDWMQKQFNLKGCFIDDVYYCPYHPSAKIKKYKKKTNLRKPGNGMIKKAFKDWTINKNKSFMIGDSEKDIICGKKSNLRSYYVEADIYYQIKNLILN